MNKSESKYFNTAVRMDQAMIDILERKDFEYITIKEICEKAKVNRSTFYLHYENTRDLLMESIQYMNGQFLTYFQSDSQSIVKRLKDSPKEELDLIRPEYLIPYLNYIKEHRRIFRTALMKSSSMNLEETYQRMFRHVFNPIMEKFEIPVGDRRYIAAFYINGIIAIVSEWLRGDCDKTVSEISDIIMKCAKSFRHCEEQNI